MRPAMSSQLLRARALRAAVGAPAPRALLAVPRPAAQHMAFSSAAAPHSSVPRAATGSRFSPLHARIALSAPLARAAFSTSQLRRYNPNQEGVSPSVVSAFTTPFGQFIQIISRISRTLTFTALGIAAVAGAAYEATHQHVEHRSMPASAIPATGDDASGWLGEMRDESWGPTPGTDPRLGFRGRHAVRAAWIALNWGGGISPELFFGSSRAPGQIGAGGDALSLEGMPSSDGLLMCEGTLQAALDAAEKRGIRLPDVAAQRALAPPGSQLAPVPVDETALALETRLASVRERIGTPAALAGALAGYTRIYDALASSQTSATPEHQARLVRLAGRLGSVSAALGQRAEAERWLLSSLHLAGAPALLADTEEKTPSNVQGALQIDAARSSSPLAAAASSSAAAPTEASPALTRALVSSLISLSALYATAPPSSTSDESGRVALSTALRVQISALRLLRADAARSALVSAPNSSAAAAASAASTDKGARLHALWLAQHDAVLGLHVAETLYALGAASPSSGMAHALRSLWRGKDKVDVKQSIAWLDEAQRSAESVEKGLVVHTAKGARGKPNTSSTDGSLANEWSQPLQIPAARLLRDAKRVVANVEELKLALAR